ncbi:MAG TPA: DUF1849 family protein [Alphaproteobacteria bacterium]|nr:DUF1849 family protein [Alphaproteobacteria bacterium]
MRFFRLFACFLAFSLSSLPNAYALGGLVGKKNLKEEAQSILVPHKALYDINLVATRSGSQVINISGKMFYEWKPTCDAWITDHKFNLAYEYADSPGMQITSDFSTFETFDGNDFNFSARRKRDGNLYQELRGKAVVADKGGEAVFTMPEDLKFDLKKGAMFPMMHTVEMVRHARENKKFFQAVVFDGSDDEGPVEINTFIGKPVNAMQLIKPSDSLDMSLLNTPAWNVRMAVFPTLADSAASDYEMSMVFHENGIISDMLIEYDDFSVTQKLVALERVEAESCDGEKKSQNTDKKQEN